MSIYIIMYMRKQVLRLYRQIFRLARSWQALDKQNTDAERNYIKDEARRLFQKNKQAIKL